MLKEFCDEANTETYGIELLGYSEDIATISNRILDITCEIEENPEINILAHELREAVEQLKKAMEALDAARSSLDEAVYMDDVCADEDPNLNEPMSAEEEDAYFEVLRSDLPEGGAIIQRCFPLYLGNNLYNIEC